MSRAGAMGMPAWRARCSRRVLLVEGDPGVMRLLYRDLPAQGFCVVSGGAIDVMRSRHASGWLDALVIGSDVSEKPALELVRAVHGDDAPPILMLLDQPSDEAIAEALDAGGDDCMGKPFLTGEMGARLRRLMRRSLMHRGIPATIEAGSLKIDCVSWRICLGGDDVRLSVSEHAMLRMLVEKAGAVVETADARRVLQATSSSHDGRTWDDEAVRRLVGRLRCKLDLASNAALRVETLPRLGHRLRLPVRAGGWMPPRGQS